MWQKLTCVLFLSHGRKPICPTPPADQQYVMELHTMANKYFYLIIFLVPGKLLAAIPIALLILDGHM